MLFELYKLAGLSTFESLWTFDNNKSIHEIKTLNSQKHIILNCQIYFLESEKFFEHFFWVRSFARTSYFVYFTFQGLHNFAAQYIPPRFGSIGNPIMSQMRCTAKIKGRKRILSAQVMCVQNNTSLDIIHVLYSIDCNSNLHEKAISFVNVSYATQGLLGVSHPRAYCASWFNVLWEAVRCAPNTWSWIGTLKGNTL